MKTFSSYTYFIRDFSFRRITLKLSFCILLMDEGEVILNNTIPT